MISFICLPINQSAKQPTYRSQTNIKTHKKNIKNTQKKHKKKKKKKTPPGGGPRRPVRPRPPKAYPYADEATASTVDLDSPCSSGANEWRLLHGTGAGGCKGILWTFPLGCK